MSAREVAAAVDQTDLETRAIASNRALEAREQRARVTAIRREQQGISRGKTWQRLEAKLLSIAPGRVVPMPEPNVKALLEFGAVVAGPVRARRGEPNRCHYNAAIRWLRNPAATIYTGYYHLSDKWIQHSWNVLRAEILDRADFKAVYFGVAPSDPARFMLDQIVVSDMPPDLLAQHAGFNGMKRFLQLAQKFVSEAQLSLSTVPAGN